MQRIFDRTREAISISQAAYSPGRGASELILAFKLLAEKAITSQNYEFHILMLDMSRAFDTISRASVIENLKEILNPDEIHLISLLIKDVTLQVKCDNHLGRKFTTNVGSPQGDCASPLLFIFELSKALEKSKKLISSHSNSNLLKNINKDHSYCKKEEDNQETEYVFSISQEYADDCSAGSTDSNLIDKFEEQVPVHLENSNFDVNKEKTERFTVSHNGDETWKNVVFLGSKLDTESDISRRKQLASAAWSKYKNLLQNKKLPLLLRVKYFETFIGSIFLHQCGIWTLTKKLERTINVFQNNFLRWIVGTKYPKRISNTELHKITNQRPWSEVCQKRRLSLFGHTCRLPTEAPSRKALFEAIRKVKKLIGGQKKTLIGLITEDLKTVNTTISDAIIIAKDKTKFQDLVHCVMSRQKSEGQQGRI